jgi:hypothetical protein
VAEPPLKVTEVLDSQTADIWGRGIWFQILTELSVILNVIWGSQGCDCEEYFRVGFDTM